MKKNAFSLIEIIISITLLILTIFPILKINSKQIKIIKKLELYNSSSNFFFSINHFLLNEKIFFSKNNLFEFKNYEEIRNCELFRNLNLLYYPKHNFLLKISFEVEDIDFSHNYYSCNIVKLNFVDSTNNLTSKIIKFKD